MIDGNVNEFADLLRRGAELWFVFRGVKYFFQGWREENGLHVFVIEVESSEGNSGYYWTAKSMHIEECAEAFFSAPIWAGKTFWEVENEMTWVD